MAKNKPKDGVDSIGLLYEILKAITNRLDRIEQKLDTIERRLDKIENPLPYPPKKLDTALDKIDPPWPH